MIRFDEYVNRALYGEPGGFFADGGGAGRAGADFLTSPEVGPLFGAVVANYLDERWSDLGEPAEFHVIEAAAGRGALAIAVRAAEPRCGAALRYHLVERSPALRARHGDHLDVDGVRFSSAADLPTDPVEHGVLIANELLDNIPFRLLQRAHGGWDEVWVDADDDGSLFEELMPVDADTGERATALASGAEAGARIPLQDEALAWVRMALRTVHRGALLTIDYGDVTSALAARPVSEWLRTYRSHGRGDGPLEYPGTQDITCDVAWDQMSAAGAHAPRVRQAEWLRRYGLDELVAQGEATWAEHAHAPDLAAFAGRSRAVEAEAIADPAGLGAFDVVEWRLPS